MVRTCEVVHQPPICMSVTSMLVLREGHNPALAFWCHLRWPRMSQLASTRPEWLISPANPRPGSSAPCPECSGAFLLPAYVKGWIIPPCQGQPAADRDNPLSCVLLCPPSLSGLSMNKKALYWCEEPLILPLWLLIHCVWAVKDTSGFPGGADVRREMKSSALALVGLWEPDGDGLPWTRDIPSQVLPPHTPRAASSPSCALQGELGESSLPLQPQQGGQLEGCYE